MTQVDTRAGIVWVPDAWGPGRLAEEAVERLTAAGLQVVVAATPHLEGPRPTSSEAVEQGLEALSDAEILKAIDEARRTLTAPRIAVCGSGLGGTAAMTARAALAGFDAAVVFDPRLVYPVLGARKPVQPMDLLPGSRAPLQVHSAADDPLVQPRQLEELRERLGRSGIVHQVCSYANADRGLIDPDAAGYDPRVAHLAWSRASAFLRRVLRSGSPT